MTIKSRFASGIMLLFGGTIAFAVVKFVMPYIITGTSFSENIMTYLVPLALFIAVIIGIFYAWFKPRKQQ